MFAIKLKPVKVNGPAKLAVMNSVASASQIIEPGVCVYSCN
jgi:hypothetical protein